MPPHENCSKTHISAYTITTTLELTSSVGTIAHTSSILGERKPNFSIEEGKFGDNSSTAETQHGAMLEIEVIHHQPALRSILKTSSGNGSSRKNAQVQFKNVHIRTFPQVLGDHPCCSSGLPLSLDWRHCSEQTISVDEIEGRRVPSRRKDLKLDDTARKTILQGCTLYPTPSSISLASPTASSSLYSKDELRKAERKLCRERQRMRKRSIVNQFFSPVNTSV